MHATLGAALHKRGDVGAAAAAYDEALAAKERSLGSTHPELVPTLNNVGLLLAQSGRFDEAEAAYRRALGLLEQAGLPEHPQHERVTRNLRALARRRQDSLLCGADAARCATFTPESSEPAERDQRAGEEQRRANHRGGQPT